MVHVLVMVVMVTLVMVTEIKMKGAYSVDSGECSYSDTCVSDNEKSQLLV